MTFFYRASDIVVDSRSEIAIATKTIGKFGKLIKSNCFPWVESVGRDLPTCGPRKCQDLFDTARRSGKIQH